MPREIRSGFFGVPFETHGLHGITDRPANRESPQPRTVGKSNMTTETGNPSRYAPLSSRAHSVQWP